MMKAGASDAIEIDASALLDELAPVDPHPTPTTPFDQAGGSDVTHTIPLEQSPLEMDTKDETET